MDRQGIEIILVELVKVYKIVAESGPDVFREKDEMVYTKYKTMHKQSKPAVAPVPANHDQKRKETLEDLTF